MKTYTEFKESLSLAKNIGGRIIGKKIDQVLTRRKQNMGASDLKGSSSGMS